MLVAEITARPGSGVDRRRSERCEDVKLLAAAECCRVVEVEAKFTRLALGAGWDPESYERGGVGVFAVGLEDRAPGDGVVDGAAPGAVVGQSGRVEDVAAGSCWIGGSCGSDGEGGGSDGGGNELHFNFGMEDGEYLRM